MDDELEARRRLHPRTILFGLLGCFGAVVLMIGGAVLFNLDSIQELMEVSSALHDEFGIDAEVGPYKDLGSGLTSLQIDVRSSDFQGDDPGAKAREIAVLAAKVLSSPGDYDHVEVRFVNRIGGVIHFQTTEGYQFPMSELLPLEPVGSDK